MVTTIIDEVHIKKCGIGESSGFNILATPEAFRILSDGLYSCKITAVIRELGTNMYDAHVATNNLHKPPIVHVPTTVEPWYSGRDFGPGLGYIVYDGDQIAPDYSNVVYGPAQLDECEMYCQSLDDRTLVKIADEVQTVYTTYFLSTKIKSNDFVGQLGLGSKSPLAITDTFTIISYFNNIKRTYLCYLNEKGLPEVNHLAEQDVKTDEPNGLCVQFAVKLCDCNEFQEQIMEVYRHFVHRPKFEGEALTIPDTTFFLKMGDWGIYHYEHGYSGAKAIMGNICYPIIGEKIHGLPSNCVKLLNQNIEIRFPIGSLDITPSREQLSYSKNTQKILIKKLKEIMVEVNTGVQHQFEDCKTMWEARCLANDTYIGSDASLNMLGKLADVYALKWNGIRICGHIRKFSTIGNIEAWEYSKIPTRHNFWSNSPVDKKKCVIKRRKVQSFTPTSKAVYYEVDISRGSFSRCKTWMNENAIDLVYLVKFHTPQAKKDFLEEMGMDGTELTPTSTLPKPLIRRTVFHNTIAQVFSHNGDRKSYRRLYEYWNEDSMNLTDGGVYVEICRYRPRYNGEVVHPCKIGHIMFTMRQCGYEVSPVIGVRSSVAKKFRESDNWVDIYTYAREMLRIDNIKNNLSRHLANAIAIEDFKRYDFYKTILDNTNIKSGLMKEFLDKIDTMEKSVKQVRYQPLPNWKRYIRLAELVDYQLVGDCDYDLDEQELTITKAYPFFNVFLEAKEQRYHYNHINDIEVSIITHYIELIDKSREKIDNVKVA